MQVNTLNQNIPPSEPTEIIKTNANNKTKRKSRWKLKFHHQALPPEYLNHYEASLQQQQSYKCVNNNVLRLPPPNMSALGATTFHLPSIGSEVSVTPLQSSSIPPFASPSNHANTFASVAAQRSTVRYKDLPYMGEMTLDNARPRRGRKPKKADICHLIYKNYGTTVVDEPLNLCVRDLRNQVTTLSSSSNRPSVPIQYKFKFTGDGVAPTLQPKRTIASEAGSIQGATDSIMKCAADKTIPRTHRETKRKSRKSLAREKLEKTFKERGFLIQTQQLESAQGATYCKFRQLRKFTRYLFRSWKHHLPGDIVNNNSL